MVQFRIAVCGNCSVFQKQAPVVYIQLILNKSCGLHLNFHIPTILQVNKSLIKIKNKLKCFHLNIANYFMYQAKVDILHWKSFVKANLKLQIKVYSKLTQDHIQPHFQTMNVRMAFQI